MSNFFISLKFIYLRNYEHPFLEFSCLLCTLSCRGLRGSSESVVT